MTRIFGRSFASRGTRALATAAAVALAVTSAVLWPSAAFAGGSNEVLSYGGLNPSGTNVSTTDLITASSAAGSDYTFITSTFTIVCTKVSVEAKAISNPTAPGTATVSITELTFGGCTVTGGPFSSVVSIVLAAPAAAEITDGTTPHFDVTSLDEDITLHTALGNILCAYGTTSSIPSIEGVITNPNSSGTGGAVTFSSAPVGLISGSAVCGAAGSTGRFTGTFSYVSDTSGTGSNIAVYVN